MIEVSCRGCSHEFEVPDMRAGVAVLCPVCFEKVQVPKAGETARAPGLVGAGAAATGETVHDESRMRVDPSMDEPGFHDAPSPYAVEEELGAWEEPAGDAFDAGERTLEPHIEDDNRRRNLFRIGLALVIAFFAPIAGVPGRPLVFPQFTEFPGLSMAGFVLLLPLFAGAAVMWTARRGDPPLRGTVVVSAGSALLLLFLIHGGTRSMISNSFSVLPGSVTFSTLLFLIGGFGLVVGTRARWYRPVSRPAHLIGAVAAVSYLLYLLIPVNGSMPFGQPFEMFKFHKGLGLALIAHLGLMIGAAGLCLRNAPSTLSSVAGPRAGRAFCCLVAAVVVPFLFFCVAAMSMPGGGPTMIISTALKFGVMYGGLMLLIPIGVVDLLVGRP